MSNDVLWRPTLRAGSTSKDRLDSQVAMPIEALSEVDLDRLEQSKAIRYFLRVNKRLEGDRVAQPENVC